MSNAVTDVLPLSQKQTRVLARSTKRVNLYEGSIRSGKTFTQLIAWLVFIATAAPKRGALVMIGKTRESTFRNLFEPIENDPTLAVFRPFVHYRQGAPTALMFGRVVHIIGANDAKAESKIRGFTVAGALVDELTVLPREFFAQLLGRMSVDGARLFATTNPDAPRHWLKVDYLNRIGELVDWYVEHFTMRDNPGLSSEYIESLEREHSGVWRQRFIEGLWVSAEGAVYPEFDVDKHAISRASLPTIDEVLIVGLDYGTTHRTRGYLLGRGQRLVSDIDGVTVSRPALFVLDEFAPDTATVGQHVSMLQNWLADQPVESWRRPTWIAVDPAAAVVRQELFDRGQTNTIRAHNSVLAGIQTISSLLANDRLFIVRESCPHLINSLPGYRWDSAAAAKGETRPIKQDDDEADALRYAIFTSRRYWRDTIPLAPADNRESMEDE
jgi:hypothetical protein